MTRRLPKRLIADRGYDWRALWERLKKRGVDLIAPHLTTRKHIFQDRRKLRRYRRRWIIERTNAWLFNFRRLVVRYERSIERFKSFLQLACALTARGSFETDAAATTLGRKELDAALGGEGTLSNRLPPSIWTAARFLFRRHVSAVDEAFHVLWSR